MLQHQPHQAPDSRTRVVLAAASEASLYCTGQSRIADLRLIAQTVYGHEQRLVQAMQTGWLTAQEAVEYLDIQQPHARLTKLRECLPIIDRWVLSPTVNGKLRRSKAYTVCAEALE